MKAKATAVLLAVGCSTGPESASGMYTIATRHLATGVECTELGSLTEPAVPYFQLTNNDGRLAWSWCASPTQCNPIGTDDWFEPDGDRWVRAVANIANAPNEGGTYCALGFDTLRISKTGDNVHVDLERKVATGDAAACTPEIAVATHADGNYCHTVDRYDLVRL